MQKQILIIREQTSPASINAYLCKRRCNPYVIDPQRISELLPKLEDVILVIILGDDMIPHLKKIIKAVRESLSRPNILGVGEKGSWEKFMDGGCTCFATLEKSIQEIARQI